MTSDTDAFGEVAGLRTRRITADHIAESLREAILSGSLADGAELNQATLATHFGVSRVPVREAMRELRAEGLIDGQAHRRAVVRSLDIARLLETYELRAVVEGHLVEVAAPRVDAKLLGQLRALERDMRPLKDHGEWLDANAEFHRRLYEPAANQTAFEIIELLRRRAERYVRLWSGGAGLHQPEEAGRDHVAVLEQVARHDGAAARRSMQRHILHTRDRLAAYSERMAAG